MARWSFRVYVEFHLAFVVGEDVAVQVSRKVSGRHGMYGVLGL